MNGIRIAFCIAVVFLLTTGNAVFTEAGNATPFNSDIYNTIDRLREKLSMVPAGGTRNRALSRTEKAVHIRRTFTNYQTKRVEKRDIAGERQEILRACCSDHVIRDHIDQGISFHFDYYGKNGLYITSTVVDRRACKPRSFSRQHAEIIDRDGVYTVYANGIVKDASTNLEWFAGPDRNITWGQANAWVRNLRVGGGGWRMPTLKELESLYKKGAGPRNMTPFLKTRGWWVWSGETVGAREARSFSFGNGFKAWIFRGNSASERVFAVRSPGNG